MLIPLRSIICHLSTIIIIVMENKKTAHLICEFEIAPDQFMHLFNKMALRLPKIQMMTLTPT